MRHISFTALFVLACSGGGSTDAGGDTDTDTAGDSAAGDPFNGGDAAHGDSVGGDSQVGDTRSGDTSLPPGDAAALPLEVGTGSDEFEALTPGGPLSLVQGPQGGHHVFGSVRVHGVPTTPNNRVRFELESGAVLIASAEFTPTLEPAGDYLQLVGIFVMLDFAYYGPDFADQPATLTARFSPDGNDFVYEHAVDVVLDCCASMTDLGQPCAVTCTTPPCADMTFGCSDACLDDGINEPYCSQGCMIDPPPGAPVCVFGYSCQEIPAGSAAGNTLCVAD